MDDAELLHRYVTDRSSQAFAAIVDRYGAMVRATARRHVDTTLADDVAQATFVLLATKADRLGADRSLAAWLLTTARFVALNERKIRERARRREARLQHMWPAEPTTSATHDEVDRGDDLIVHGALVDEAIGRLKPKDRDALLWRVAESASFESIAQRQGSTTDATRKRVSRALERVRTLLRRRGVQVPAAAVGKSLAGLFALDVAGRSLPPHVHAALVQAGTADGVVSPTASLFAKGALTLMVAKQMKLAAAGVASLLLLLLGVVGITLWARSPRIVETSDAPTPIASSTAEPPFQHVFSDGTVAIISGIRSIAADGSASDWWDPQGRPATMPFAEPDYVKLFHKGLPAVTGAGRRAVEVCIRIERDSTRRSLAQRVRLAGSNTSVSTYIGDPKGLTHLLYVFVVDEDEAPIDVSIATGALREFERIAPGQAQATRIDTSGRRAPWRIASLGERDGKLTVRMTDGHPDDPAFVDEAWQLNAFKPDAWAYFPSGSTNDGQDQVFTFPISLAQTDHVLYRYRPYETASLGTIRLAPNGPTTQPATTRAAR